jgi:hypothetical protein
MCSTTEFKMWMPGVLVLPSLDLVFVVFYLHKNWAIFFQNRTWKLEVCSVYNRNTDIRSLFILSPLLLFKFKVRLMSRV